MKKHTENNFTGDLKGFPVEILNWIEDEQELQGNPRDASVIDKYYATLKDMEGFNWANSENKDDFCREVLKHSNFDLFFERYPKTEQSILSEAEGIVNGSRSVQYGDAKTRFDHYAKITNLLLDEAEKIDLSTIGLTQTIIAKVMIAIKLGRESHAHKRDNLVDLAGYAHILNELSKQ